LHWRRRLLRAHPGANEPDVRTALHCAPLSAPPTAHLPHHHRFRNSPFPAPGRFTWGVNQSAVRCLAARGRWGVVYIRRLFSTLASMAQVTGRPTPPEVRCLRRPPLALGARPACAWLARFAEVPVLCPRATVDRVPCVFRGLGRVVLRGGRAGGVPGGAVGRGGGPPATHPHHAVLRRADSGVVRHIELRTCACLCPVRRPPLCGSRGGLRVPRAQFALLIGCCASGPGMGRPRRAVFFPPAHPVREGWVTPCVAAPAWWGGCACVGPRGCLVRPTWADRQTTCTPFGPGSSCRCRSPTPPLQRECNASGLGYPLSRVSYALHSRSQALTRKHTHVLARTHAHTHLHPHTGPSSPPPPYTQPAIPSQPHSRSPSRPTSAVLR
jgi:hypothetical protein